MLRWLHEGLSALLTSRLSTCAARSIAAFVAQHSHSSVKRITAQKIQSMSISECWQRTHVRNCTPLWQYENSVPCKQQVVLTNHAAEHENQIDKQKYITNKLTKEKFQLNGYVHIK